MTSLPATPRYISHPRPLKAQAQARWSLFGLSAAAAEGEVSSVRAAGGDNGRPRPESPPPQSRGRSALKSSASRGAARCECAQRLIKDGTESAGAPWWSRRERGPDNAHSVSESRERRLRTVGSSRRGWVEVEAEMDPFERSKANRVRPVVGGRA